VAIPSRGGLPGAWCILTRVFHHQRHHPTAYRYGGEEFTILIPGHDIESAYVNLEEVRQQFAQSTFHVHGSVGLKNKLTKRPLGYGASVCR
jgi:PleD family two-component response regulator